MPRVIFPHEYILNLEPCEVRAFTTNLQHLCATDKSIGEPTTEFLSYHNWKKVADQYQLNLEQIWAIAWLSWVVSKQGSITTENRKFYDRMTYHPDSPRAMAARRFLGIPA